MISIQKVYYDRDITKIGVIADTHIPSRGKFIPPAVFELFEGVQLILHAGDLVEETVIKELQSLAPVEAVAGNMDPRPLQRSLGKVKLIRIGDLSIGLLHGDLIGRRADPGRFISLFLPEQPQAIVFGHLHEPVVKKHGGTLLINPGSVTDPRRGAERTCGRLVVRNNNINSEIFYLD